MTPDLFYQAGFTSFSNWHNLCILYSRPNPELRLQACFYGEVKMLHQA